MAAAQARRAVGQAARRSGRGLTRTDVAAFFVVTVCDRKEVRMGQVFICYAHKDEAARAELEDHLNNLGDLQNGFLTPPGVTLTSNTAEVDLVALRGHSVLLDDTLGLLFDRPTKHINQARDRNSDRFDADYAFQLTRTEWAALQSQFVTANPGRGGRRTPPWAYTERGVAMLATVLRTPRAAEAAKLVVETFVAARRDARTALPGNHDGIGDPGADNADKQAFKRRLASFDAGKIGD